MLEYQPKSKSTPNNPQSSQAEADQSTQPSPLALQSNSAQSAQLGLNEGSWFSSGATEKKSSTSWFSSWFGGGEVRQQDQGSGSEDREQENAGHHTPFGRVGG